MTTEKKSPKEKPPVFEEAFAQLRETVEALENGGLALEEATRLFDQGMRLAKLCNELLSTAEMKIERLQRSFGEQMAMIQESPEPEEAEEPEAE
jgi:exodeoxyribonuclease VII small subunit